MAINEFYNQSSGPNDRRKGHGYGKSQSVPSFGTGIGSERSMGSSSTGIYPEPPLSYDEEDEDIESGDIDIDKFVRIINKSVRRSDPTFWPRADRGSLGQSATSSAASALALTEKSLPVEKGQPLPKAMTSIAPFPSSILYPKGFDGPPLGSGNAGQAFRTTGNLKRTGTQYGSSRAPIDQPAENEFDVMTFRDILDLDQSERSILRQRIKIMKILNRLDEADEYYSV